MNIKSFFVAALSSALDLEIATPADVLEHVTPEVLAQSLPRPLWARLLTACVGAPKVDAQLVVETIGVSNLCEHVPADVIWRCIESIGARSLGLAVTPPPITTSASGAVATPIVTRSSATSTPAKPLAVSAPPPPEEKKAVTAAPVPAGPSIPAPTTDLGEGDEATTAHPLRARTPTGQRFRQTNTNIGRLAAQSAARRPQAAVPTSSPSTEPTTPPVAPRVRRGETDSDFEMETSVGTGNADDWKNALAVEDEQLVDWSTSDETTATTDSDRYGRKR